jgi:hypothetical protein
MRILFLALTLLTLNAQAFELYCDTMSCGWLNKTSIVESGDKLKVTIWHAYGLHLPELTAGFKLPKETETVEFEIPKSSCEFSKTNSILLDCNTKDVEMVFSDYDKKFLRQIR